MPHVRQAVLAILDVLLGFLALGVFAYLAFGRGPASDDSFLLAFKVAAGLAVIELAVLLARPAPTNRLIVGANVWLMVGGAAAVLQQWWLLKLYQHFGEASLFGAMLAVGLLSTMCSPAGFVGWHGRPVAVRRASWILLIAVGLALCMAIAFRGNIRYAAVLPVIALSWLGRWLRRHVAQAS